MWDKFDGIIKLRDELREHLVDYQDEPTGDNMTRVNRTLTDFHVLLTELHDELTVKHTTVYEEPGPVNSELYKLMAKKAGTSG